MPSILATLMALLGALMAAGQSGSSDDVNAAPDESGQPGITPPPDVPDPAADETPPEDDTDEDDTPDDDTPSEPTPPVTPTPPVIPTPPVDDSDEGQDDTHTPPVVPDKPTLEQEGSNASFEIEAGRTLNVKVSDNDIASVRIIDGPQVGNITVNPDNSLAVVMSHPDVKDFTGEVNFSYEITHMDGSLETVNATTTVTATTQDSGWGSGEFYMLETDEDGELIIEHGDNHREVYVSGDDAALSLEEIAEIEDMRVGQVTGEWLANSEYGRSPHTALDAEAGRALWEDITGADSEPGSHWMLFEKGYDYDVGRMIGGGAEGESELHPLYIGSYGTGTLPVLSGDLRVFQQDSANIVIRDVAFGNNFQAIEGGNFILDGVDNNGQEIAFQNDGAVTLRNSKIADSHKEAPVSGGDTWEAHPDKVQGLFVNHAQGVLLENNFFDLNGFELDYSPDADADYGQTPSMFNHNIYVNHSAGDVTLRDNIILRGASFGAQIRPGGFIEDNVFAGNNIGVNTLGGISTGDGVQSGNFSLHSGNVITDGGFHIADEWTGASTWGLSNEGNSTSLVNNIIAHLIEPGTTPIVPDSYVPQHGQAIVDADTQDFYFNDTIIYNWVNEGAERNSEDENIEGLNTDILDQVTIQNFTAQLLSQSDADVGDLADFLRAQYADGLPDLIDADVIIRFFQDGFGMTSATDGMRTDSATLRFVPNDVADGVRWDNRLNWDSEDLPGVADGDSVDLGGNWVIYGGTTTIENLDLGNGGSLSATHGYLEVSGTVEVGEDGGEINIDNAGQIWIEGYSDSNQLDIDVDGGRFANTGDMDGAFDITITDNAQAILATDGASMTVADGSNVTLVGNNVDTGFDGEGAGLVTFEIGDGGALNFVADADGVSTISEFRSGRFEDDGSDLMSTVNLTGGTLGIDVSALGGGAFEDTLIEVDEITGAFDAVELTGLLANQDAQITVNYDTDTITLNLTAAGGGAGDTKVNVIDTLNPSSAELWAALTEGQGTYSDAPTDTTTASDNDDIVDIA